MTEPSLFTARQRALKWLAAFAGAAFLLLAGPAVAASGDRIGAGDTIRVTVFQNPDLTTETRVSDAGTIGFPLIGEVHIGGLTPSAAAARIATQLRRGNFLVKPQVSLTVTELRSRQVSVLGQVNKPGRYVLDDTSSRLTDVLALAGGISTVGSDKVNIVLTRDGKIQKLEIDLPKMVRSGDLSKNLVLHNGDTIYVQRAPVFYIYGEVQHAGAYRLEDNMTVMQALSLGGGLTQRATERGINVTRHMPDGKVKKVEVSLTDPVHPDDVIYVKESFF